MAKKLEILLYPNPILLQKSKKITYFDNKLKELSQNMLKTLEDYQGIGLAAPQIGVLQRIFVEVLDWGRVRSLIFLPLLLSFKKIE